MLSISQLILEDTFLLKTSSTGRRSGRDWSKTIQVNVCNLGGHTTDVMKHMVIGIKKSQIFLHEYCQAQIQPNLGWYRQTIQ